MRTKALVESGAHASGRWSEGSRAAYNQPRAADFWSDWTGLDNWSGLDWTAAGLDWTAADFRSDWTGLDDWTELEQTGLDWTSADFWSDWTGLDWTGLDWTGLDWTGLEQPDYLQPGLGYTSNPGKLNLSDCFAGCREMTLHLLVVLGVNAAGKKFPAAAKRVSTAHFTLSPIVLCA